MGNNTSGNNDVIDDPLKYCSLVSKEDVTALGQISIYKENGEGRQFLVLQSNYSIPNPEMAEAEVSALRMLDGVKNYCRVFNSHIERAQLLCFDNYVLTVGFEYYPENLETLSSSNSKQINPDEGDLWLIIEDLIQFLSDLNSFGLTHGDLQPKFILFNSNRVVKVVCPLLYTVYGNAYQLRLANDDYHSTFAPELLEAYEHRSVTPENDPLRSDIFSLGICILGYVLHQDYRSFYDFHSNLVKVDRVRLLLSELPNNGYSEELFYFLSSCLKPSFYDRANLDSLKKIIQTRKKRTKNLYWQ